LGLMLAGQLELTALLLHFMRALLNLLFQVGVRFLQAAGHVIELVGEHLQFVAGLDCDSLAEIAAAEARSAGPQGLDRTTDWTASKACTRQLMRRARNMPASTAMTSAASSTYASRSKAE